VGAGGRLRLTPALVGVALGSVAYGIVVTTLSRWPAAIHTRGHGGAARPVWIAAFLVVVVMVALVDRSQPGLRASTDRRTRVALVLVGFGAAWVAWGLVEQHLLQTFILDPDSPWSGAWDGLFHGIGVLTAGVGTSMISGTRQS